MRVVGIAMGVVLGLATAAAHASPVRFTQDYDFVASNQSLWGGGTGFSFGTKGQKGWSKLNFDWDIGASTGTVSADVDGTVAVDYSSWRKNPGPVDLTLSFLGDTNGGSLNAALGAWARVHATLGIQVDLLDKGFGVNPSTSFTPALGASFTAKDGDAVAGVGVDIGIFKTGVSLDVLETDTLRLDAIAGNLVYGLRGSGRTQQMPFLITGQGAALIQPNLDQLGTWDFALADLELDNELAVDFDLGLTFYETHPEGIEWCHRHIWGVTIRWPCGLSYDTNEWSLASLDVYDGRPFALDFADVPRSATFSIAVVSEPASLPLLGLSLAAALVAGLRARRRGHPLAAAATDLPA